MSSKNTSLDLPGDGFFSDIHPLLAAAIHFARAWFTFSLAWEVLSVIFFRVLPEASQALASSGWQLACGPGPGDLFQPKRGAPSSGWNLF